MANTYTVGALVRCSGVFANYRGVEIDPVAVFFTVTNPSVESLSYTYGEDDELVKDSVGDYHVDVDTTGEAGTWTYRFWSTGTGQAAEEGTFIVAASGV